MLAQAVAVIPIARCRPIPSKIRNPWRSGAAMTDAAVSQDAIFRALLLRIARTQDREAFAQLFTHFAPRLKAFNMRAGVDPDAAEDLAHEAMIQVWRRAASFDPAKAAVSTWIFTIARNKRIDRLRRERYPDLVSDENRPEEFDTAPAADERLEAEQYQRIVREAVKQLPPEQARIVHMAFFEDKSHASIAVELALPLGTVKSRIRLALVRLREFVAERE